MIFWLLSVYDEKVPCRGDRFINMSFYPKLWYILQTRAVSEYCPSGTGSIIPRGSRPLKVSTMKIHRTRSSARIFMFPSALCPTRPPRRPPISLFSFCSAHSQMHLQSYYPWFSLRRDWVFIALDPLFLMLLNPSWNVLWNAIAIMAKLSFQKVPGRALNRLSSWTGRADLESSFRVSIKSRCSLVASSTSRDTVGPPKSQIAAQWIISMLLIARLDLE